MRNTNIVAGLSAVALVALVITGFATKGEETKTAKKENQTTTEYTGNLVASSSLFSTLCDNVENNDELKKQTGSLVFSEGGISQALDGYGTYMAQADQVSGEASVEALDVALKFVPEGSALEGYTNLGVSNVEDYLNVRKAPGTDQSIIGKMPGGAACEILGEENGWYQIQSGSVTGYVSKEYILSGYDANVRAMETKQHLLRVNCDVLNVRQEPSQDCQVATKVENGELLEILEDEKDGWYKININNLEGYVKAEYVDSIYTLPTAEEIGTVGSTEGSASIAQEIINYAYQFLGNSYVYGGNSLTNGTDCSGFCKLIYAQFGYSLPRYSLAYPNAGTRIDYRDAQPGDILVYRYGDGSGHVAIYIGNGKIIHASTPKTGICIGNAYFTTPYCAVRVIS